MNKITFDWNEFDNLTIELNQLVALLNLAALGLSVEYPFQANAISAIENSLNHVCEELHQKQQGAMRAGVQHG
ncbi:hypothetical protein [Testudinibacter sp. TR-2022]|uniref:hypothetical protein n=1 Tax=Testudinibacter sp. TR-2022 TaxID=2585029 RepID=UPI001118148C|nr:hypothetical protein [Testudinibacter sp. TR-2022]TNH07972.1 hypothetical protein FHQ30_03510 [Pasteurellaceae bacterium Phil11]TNH23188.1 hypothetical protein FHQ27_11730 [Testudinibacter sp. TR-2022]TNH23870.1 hypothetical protein FHQ29_04605 [Testudinibacter sp. TR-2022]